MTDGSTLESDLSRRQFLEVSAASLATFTLIDSRCTGKNAKAHTASGTSTIQTLADLYREAAQVLFQARPLSATDNGLSEEDVGQHYANRLGDFSPEAEQRLRQHLRQLSSRIRDYLLTSASQGEQETREVMLHLMQLSAGPPDFSVGITDYYGILPFPVTQLAGPPLDVFYTLQYAHQIEHENDAMDYIERLRRCKDMFASVQEKIWADSGQDWIPPKVILERAIVTFDNIQKLALPQHPLVKTLAEKLETVDGLSGEKREALIAQARKNVSEVVCPAYQALIEKTRSLITKARAESGIWAQPNGEEFYQNAIHQLGGSDLSAEEIHRLGLSEVERIAGEMDALLRDQDYKKGTVAQRMVALGEEPRFLYPDTEDGRRQLIDDLNQRVEVVTAKMKKLSKTAPSQHIEIRPIPVELQDGAPPGMYMGASADASRPAIFMVNLRDMKANRKFFLPTLVYHETVPGHHWQISLAMGLKDLPLLRRVTAFTAYAEGWALYAEQLAAELGLYEDDPFGNLGRLQAELFRAARLVVDTGLHHKRWTREKAIQYLDEMTGQPESLTASEVERYMIAPGQALGYKLGMLKMLELRDRAKTQLGKRFDLAEFHDIILLGGAMPLMVLERRVNNWIATTKDT